MAGDITTLLKNFEDKLNSRLDSFQKDLQDAKAALQNNISESSERITQDIAQVRGEIISNLVHENRRLQATVSTLVDRLIKVEKQANETEQQNRKSNIEIVGIPATFVQNREEDKLRPIVAQILNHISVSEIGESDIEAVHRLRSKVSPYPTIVRLKRNLVDEVKRKENKKKLSTVAATLGLPEGTKIFINENQSRNMKELSYNARLLKRGGMISDTWFSNAAVRIKKLDESVVKITHESDLYQLFPEFQFSFDTSLYVPENVNQDQEDIARFMNLEGAWNIAPHSAVPTVSQMGATNTGINVSNSLSMSGVYAPPITRQGARNLSMSGGIGRS